MSSLDTSTATPTHAAMARDANEKLPQRPDSPLDTASGYSSCDEEVSTEVALAHRTSHGGR